MRQKLKAIGIIDPQLEFLGCEFASGFNHRPLAMPPVRLNRIEPRTLGWQLADEDAHPSAWRIVSSLTRLAVSCCVKQTSAANSKVQVERAFPKSRGERCNSSRNCSLLAASSSGRALFGREDCRCKQALPRATNSRITSRTVWSVHPTCCAICGALRPAALASRIWLRREGKASPARKPARKCRSSSVVSGRTKTGVFIRRLSYSPSLSPIGRLVLH